MPYGLALIDFGLLQNCRLIPAIMIQFLEVKHRYVKKKILPKLSILTQRLALCYATPPCEGRAVNRGFEHDMPQK
jgi:hypothetical protein